MSKLFWGRKFCCGCGCCFHCLLSSHKTKRDRPTSYTWRKTVVFGVFVFTLYFALLSFVSFLAVSNHRSARTPLLPIHPATKNGTFADTSYGAGARGGNSSIGTGLITIERSLGSRIRLHSNRDSSSLNDMMRSRTIFKCVPIHFREESGPAVALASFPGSGNTWLRYLLQLSTGILTGSVYKDFALLRNGFPAESIKDGRVLVVKTHESGETARSLFQKAILLVRKPSEAILAEFNRRAAGHIGHAGRDKYTRNAGRYWSQFVAQKAKSWTETNLDWIEHFKGPLLITMYHHLEPVSEMVMHCVQTNKEGIYRRRKKQSQFNPFTPRMEKFLASQEKIVYTAIQRRIGLSNDFSTDLVTR
ncbi:unnamed protein product [Allacma fusca]|uniref:Uncharacterized protein n=1 Tax=Allacma fusca TaxID=39272 RepID=A0A8J2PBH5_9HEXA|nr:unnamed protein product [Allacma fusca]